MPLQPEMPASKANTNSALHIPGLFTFILQAYPGVGTLTVKRPSEEHRNANYAFKVVRGLFFTEHVDVIQVITEVQMQCN